MEWGESGAPKAVTSFATLRHQGAVIRAAFSPDGRVLATAGDDGVRIWNVTSGELPAVVGSGERVLDVAFSPDGGELMLAIEDDFTASIYSCPICDPSLESLLALARDRVTRDLTLEERARHLPD